jgi:predicted nucleic acid-binding protein
MILEAIQKLAIAPNTAVRKLKENPQLVQQLSHYRLATETIPAFNIAVEAVTSTHLRTAQELSGTYGLLTNDSINVAVMQSLALTNVASNDPDFSAVPALTVWQPKR